MGGTVLFPFDLQYHDDLEHASGLSVVLDNRL